MRALLVAAARPNFMKVKPVLDALESRGVECVLVHTGQHYDAAMSDVFFDDLGIRAPDHHLGVGSGTHAEQTGGVMVAFERLLRQLADGDVMPDVVVVPGDVNSTLACAVVGAKAGCLVAHVEAGLRSRDWAMPEEINRVVAVRVSDFLFAPSPDAVDNLRAEGYREDQIHLVGNVMVDTLLANVERARSRPVLGELGLQPGGYGVVTLHRPSNVDDPSVLEGLMGALTEIATELPLVFPVHPRTRERLASLADGEGAEGAGKGSGAGVGGVRLVEPLGYLDFLALQAGSALTLTDSGGIQEETTVLGVPCLTLRDNTERPITVSEGTNELVGTSPDAIVTAARAVLAEGVEPRRPLLWDGKAGERIADVLVERCTEEHAGPRLRPTSLRRG